MFSKSAHLYDAIYSRLDYEGFSVRIHELIQDRKPGAASLLDVACGTGGHLQFLARDYLVEGLDLDSGMLAVAKAKLPKVPFHEANMVDFNLGKRFDAVICMFSSIGYAKTPENLNKAVASMARHIDPGGVLIVEPWILPENWDDDHPGEATLIDLPGLKITRVGSNVRQGRLTILEMHHLVLSQKQVEYISETHALCLFTSDEYRSAFARAGLAVEHDVEGLMGRGLFIGVAPV